MMTNYTAVVRRDGEWWIGWIEELAGANAQAATRSELLDDLEVIIGECLSWDRRRSSSLRDDQYRLMIPIQFRDTKSKRLALGALAGRYPFESRATGLMLVPDAALRFLTEQEIEYHDPGL